MQIPTLTMIPFNPKSKNENIWAWAIEYQISTFIENNSNDPPPSAEFVAEELSYINYDSQYHIEIFLATMDDTLYGTYATMTHKKSNPQYDDNKHVMLGTIWVKPEFRRQGIGTQLLKHVVALAQDRNMTVLQLDSENEAGNRFAEQFGGTVAITANENRLYNEDIDWNMVQGWYDTAKSRLTDVKVELVDGLIGRKDIKAYADFYTEVYNQQPLEETNGLEVTYTPDMMRKDHRDMKYIGMRHLTFITREADGTISGMTEIFHNPKRPHMSTQGLTGVKDAYRGRGLGKFLKSAMLLYTRDELPKQQFFTTTNATANAPMLRINDAMGFKLYRQTTLYKFDVDTLAGLVG